MSITGKIGDYDNSAMNQRANLLLYILTMFNNLRYLEFYQNLDKVATRVCFDHEPSIFSSTLVELHITVFLFDDCLYLLDGRLNQLRTLFVNVSYIFSPRSTISNKVNYTSKKY
jgi:hypothetical protein